MIKISFFYPRVDGGRFDLTYFSTKHMQLIVQKFGKALKRFELEKGIRGGHQGSQPEYIAVAHLYFDSIESFENVFSMNARALMVDVLKFTDIQSVVQFSEIIPPEGFKPAPNFPMNSEERKNDIG